MVYGELGSKALKWATQFVFGLNPSSMPPRVIITPLKVEEYFENFQAVMADKGLKFERKGNSFIVWKGDMQALFCEGGVGASNFADSSYILCHCGKVEEVIFVGTGGGIGEDVESADINLPTSMHSAR
jgi:purine-nucleoside phosphorylase